MARIVKSEFAPIIECVIRTHFENGTTEDKVLKTDEIVENMRYVENGEIKEVTGRVSNIITSSPKSSRKYSNVSKLKSYFRYDNPITYIEIDKSLPNHSDVVKISAGEIIEDSPVENVTKIEVFATYGASIKTLLSDGSVNEMVFHEGDALDDIICLTKEGDKSFDALLVAMTYDIKTYMPKALYTICEGELKAFDVMQVKSVGSSTPPIVTTENITEAIKEAPGDIFLADGDFTESITIGNDISINGARTGVPANTLNRDTETFVGETVLSGEIKLTEDVNLSLNGVTLTKKALLSLGKASNVEIKNCIIAGLESSEGKAFPISLPAETTTKLTIKGCYFGANSSNCYNLFELYGKLAPKSDISENYFAKGCVSHNDICIYDVEDDTTVSICDNKWEKSANGIRVGIKGDRKCTINILNNTYLSTDSDPDYAGLLLVQPYLKETTSMKDITININKTVHKDKNQIFYLYAGPTDIAFTKENAPTIKVDGKKQDLSKFYSK